MKGRCMAKRPVLPAVHGMDQVIVHQCEKDQVERETGEEEESVVEGQTTTSVKET